MPSLLLLNKPYQVLSQFTDSEGRSTLSDFIDSNEYPNFYPAGRLDFDSEGLLALTNDGQLQHTLANPTHKQPKTYWVQVEGDPNPSALNTLKQGLELKDGKTRPCKARVIEEPELWPRVPPIRHRSNVATHWLEIILSEGRNRQVRRMTAAIGLPTLRLIRYAIGPWNIQGIAPGETQLISVHLPTPSPANQHPKKRQYHKRNR